MNLHASAEELLTTLSRHDLEAVCDTLGRIRAAIGDDQPLDADHHALLVTAHIFDRRCRTPRPLRRQVHRAAAIVCICDASMCVLAASAEMTRVLGYRPGQLIGRSVTSLSALEPQEVRRRFSSLTSTGRLQGDTHMRHKNGHSVLVRYKARAFETAGRTLYMLIGDAVTERSRLRGLDETPWAGTIAAGGVYGCWACELTPRLAGMMLEPSG